MRSILPVLIAGFVLAVPVVAQRGGGGHGGGGGGMRGGGGGMRGGGGGFHGGGAVGAGFRGGGFRGAGFRGTGFRGTGFRGGFRGGFRSGFRFRFGTFPFYGGYGFYDPFFYDSYPDYSDYSNPYPYGYADSGYGSSGPSVAIVSNSPYSYPAAPPPAYAPPPEPAVRQYPPAAQEQKYETPLFLLAFKDGNIKAVLAYWVDGATLHYVSMDHEQKQGPLTSVDRDLSERFNRERNVTFRLPR
jgi:hypothetical protein